MWSKTNLGTHILEHLVGAITAWVFYRLILFRRLKAYTVFESTLILGSIVAAICATGIVLDIYRNKNDSSVAVNLALGFGIYTALAYIQIRPLLVKSCFVISGALAMLYAVCFLRASGAKSRRRRRITVKKAVWIAACSKKILGIGLSIIMMVFLVNAVLGSALMRAREYPVKQAYTIKQAAHDNIVTLQLLEETHWKNLSVQERLDVLQVVADIEQQLLGLPSELNVGASNVRGGASGCYSHRTFSVVINLDSLLNDSSWEVLNTVCHEAYHSYQHCLVEALGESNEYNDNLKIFRLVETYKAEFDNPIRAEIDFDGYYSQACETDARQYAKKTAEEYRRWVYHYYYDVPDEG